VGLRRTGHTGFVEAPSTGTYRFQTVSDDGVRVWVNGLQLINNWSKHSAATNTSGAISLNAGTRYAITMEYFEASGQAVARLRWLPPGTSSYVAVPIERLYSN
jgi:hypothetical protein